MRPALVLVCATVLLGAPATARALTATLVAPTARADGVEDLAKKLKDADEKVRRKAVEDLTASKSAEAWPLVVEALADPSPLVADEAQTRLGSADAAGLRALWGKAGTGSKDPIVQQRSIEAIGRIQVEVDGVALSKLLSNRDPDVRRVTAHAIELLALGNKLEAKSRRFALQQVDAALKNDKDDNVRAAVIATRNVLEPFTVSDLCNMLLKKDAGVVHAAATHALADAQFSQIIGQFNSSLETEEYSSVRALVDELFAHPSASSADSLTKVMSRYPQTRISWTIVDMLRDWSGLPNGLDRGFWSEWASKLPDGWKPKEPAGDGAAWGYKDAPSVLGMPVLGDNVVILIDTTKWLGEKLPDGTLARDKVKAGLAKMFEGFSTHTQFNVILCGTTAEPCEKGLVDGRPPAMQHALKLLEKCTISTRDCVLEGALAAVDDKRVDTVLVITGGTPSAARHVDLELLRAELLERNRFRQVVIEALLVNPGAGVEDEWKALCAPSRGHVKNAKL